jgi:hypothetical protein
MGEKRDRDVDSLLGKVHTPLASRFSIRRIMATSMRVSLLSAPSARSLCSNGSAAATRMSAPRSIYGVVRRLFSFLLVTRTARTGDPAQADRHGKAYGHPGCGAPPPWSSCQTYTSCRYRFAATFVLLCAVKRFGLGVLDSATGFADLLRDEFGLHILDGTPSTAEEMDNLACHTRQFAGAQDDQEEEQDFYDHQPLGAYAEHPIR